MRRVCVSPACARRRARARTRRAPRAHCGASDAEREKLCETVGGSNRETRDAGRAREAVRARRVGTHHDRGRSSRTGSAPDSSAGCGSSRAAEARPKVERLRGARRATVCGFQCGRARAGARGGRGTPRARGRGRSAGAGALWAWTARHIAPRPWQSGRAHELVTVRPPGGLFVTYWKPPGGAGIWAGQAQARSRVGCS